MTRNQIYAELNAIRKNMTGTDVSSFEVLDGNSFASLGDSILNSTIGVSNFGRALGDRLARIVTEVQAYTARNRNIRSDELTYGSALKIIFYKDGEDVSSPMYGNAPNTNPYALGKLPDYVTCTYSNEAVWQYGDLKLQREQIKRAFLNESEMGAFLEGAFQAVYNRYEMDMENIENGAINLSLVDCVKTNTKDRVINLAQLYYNHTGLEVTSDNYFDDKDFLQFASYTIKQYIKKMKIKSERYNNCTGVSMKLSDDYTIECVSPFADACKFYLESTTFHKELVELPQYSEVAYWWQPDDPTAIQASYTFTGDEDPTTAEFDCVLATIRDNNLVRSLFREMYSDSLYNPADKTTTYFFDATYGTMLVTAYPCVWFTIGAVVKKS